MFLFFVITSLLIAVVGFVFLVAPQKMLFLMSREQQVRLMEGRAYPVTARIGGVMMDFLCAPLNLIVGSLIAGLLKTQ